ncbi:ABC transporter substrate-binding protein [Bacillus sp. FSL K6-3431]|uniref:ABC transporter substrate-binding protein n=1 Tax=Bacillus sp. FSL K6-3431 TaxID=2921500 RepID=UPI0030F8A529
MPLNKNWIAYTMLFVLVLFLLVGCSKEKDVATSVNESDENVTLTVMMWDDWGQDYGKYIKEAVEEQFPHITLENVGGDTGNKEWIENALAADVVPDIIFAHRQYHVDLLKEYELGYDMTELMERHEFDLSRYDQGHLDEWKSWSNGETWLLPFMTDRYVLQYNKDVFDTFGVDYPTDGMNWQDVIDLAAKVTGERNGVQFQGLSIEGNAHLPLTQIIGQTQLIDPDTDEVLWTKNPYVSQWLQMVEQVNKIPGNIPPEGGEDIWSVARTLAMRPLWLDMSTPEDLNWDIVTYPQWKEAPNIGPLAGGWALGVTAASKHKDEAMEVMKFLYSDEHIGNLGETPIHAPFPHLFENINISEKLEGENFAKFTDKNLESLFKLKAAGGPKSRSKYDVGAFLQIEHVGTDFLKSGLDVNDFLRELTEKEEIRIKDEKGMD